MENKTMTYIERGSKDISICVERRSLNTYEVSSKGMSRTICWNLLLVKQIKRFLNDIGLSDQSGLRSVNIMKLIKQL